MAKFALGALVVLACWGHAQWYLTDALFMDAVGAVVFGVCLIMCQPSLRMRTRLLLSGGLVALGFGLVYLLMGIPPQGTLLVVWLIVANKHLILF